MASKDRLHLSNQRVIERHAYTVEDLIELDWTKEYP